MVNESWCACVPSCFHIRSLLPPGGTYEELPHVPQVRTKAFLSLYYSCWGTSKTHPGLHLLCYRPRQSLVSLQPMTTLSRNKPSQRQLSPGLLKARWRRQRDRGARWWRWGRMKGGRMKPRKKAQITFINQKNIALGILKHFQLNSQSKNKSKYWSVL